MGDLVIVPSSIGGQPAPTPAPAPAPVAPPAPAPAPAPPAATPPPAENWEGRFKGLQTTHNQVVTDARTREEGLRGEVTSLTAARDAFSTELDALKVTNQAAAASLEEVTIEAGVQGAELVKMQLLAAEAPHLIRYASYIPHTGQDGTVLDADAMRPLIKTFGELISSDTEAARTAFQQGAVPTPPPTNDPGTPGSADQSVEEAWRVMDQFAGRNANTEEETRRVAAAQQILFQNR